METYGLRLLIVTTQFSSSQPAARLPNSHLAVKPSGVAILGVSRQVQMAMCGSPKVTSAQPVRAGSVALLLPAELLNFQRQTLIVDQQVLSRVQMATYGLPNLTRTRS